MSLSFAVLLEVIYIYFLYGMGRFIENYDYASPDKLASQNGLNLSFLRFSSDQWHYFCKTLARRYYNFAAAICLCVNAVALLLAVSVIPIVECVKAIQRAFARRRKA